MQSQNSRKIAVISLSGGLDSTCLLIKLLAEGYEVHGVSFDYGQKHKVEQQRLQDNLLYLATKKIELASMNWIKLPLGDILESSLTNKSKEIPTGHYEEENMKSTVVPNRNMIFLSIIQGIALSIAIREKNEVNICLGVHSGDHAIYPDCTFKFFQAAYNAFCEGNYDSNLVKLQLPYLTYNKTIILSGCLFDCWNLGLDFNKVLKNTNTSYNPDEEGRSSGTSGSDIERIEAFLNIGMQDPVIYVKPWEEIAEDAKKVLKRS